MAEQKFAREWTYRSLQITITYPAGWTGRLPRAQFEAAQAAGVLEQEKDDGDEGAATPRPTRRSRASES